MKFFRKKFNLFLICMMLGCMPACTDQSEKTANEKTDETKESSGEKGLTESSEESVDVTSSDVETETSTEPAEPLTQYKYSRWLIQGSDGQTHYGPTAKSISYWGSGATYEETDWEDVQRSVIGQSSAAGNPNIYEGQWYNEQIKQDGKIVETTPAASEEETEVASSETSTESETGTMQYKYSRWLIQGSDGQTHYGPTAKSISYWGSGATYEETDWEDVQRSVIGQSSAAGNPNIYEGQWYNEETRQ